MGLNETPSGERVHIGFFGLRNAGKSSVVNAVTGQELAIVSDVRGTTTDPVKRAMELLPLGPVVIVDTPGVDDEGALGEARVARALRALASCDVAVLVVDGERGLSEKDRELLAAFRGAAGAERAGLEQVRPARGERLARGPGAAGARARFLSCCRECPHRRGGTRAQGAHRRPRSAGRPRAPRRGRPSLRPEASWCWCAPSTPPLPGDASSSRSR